MQLLSLFKDLTLHPKNAEELKGLILQLAVQGKLTTKWREVNPKTESASELLKRIEVEKQQLIAEKKIKKEKPLSPIEDKDKPYALPDSWIWCRFQNIVYSGFTGLERSKNLQSLDFTYGYFKMNNIGDYGQCNWEKFTHVEASDDEVEKYSLKKNDFLFNTRNSYELVGKTCIIDKDFTTPLLFNNNIFKVDFGGMIDPGFINLMFSSPVINKLLDEKKSATTNVAAIYQGKLMELVVVIPPLEEQKAIVEVVNQLFAELEQLEGLTKERISLKEDFLTSGLGRLTETDNTTQEWNYLQQHFPSFFTEKKNITSLRETILQLAVQGKLTAKWREENPSVEHASELLKRIETEKQQLIAEKKIKKEKPLNPIEDGDKPYELPEGWIWSKLGAISQVVGGGTPQSSNPEFFCEDGIAWFTPADLGKSKTKYVDKGRRDVTELGLQKSSAQLMPAGSILFSSRAPIGHTAIGLRDFCTNQGFKSSRPYVMDMNEYIYYYLRSIVKEANKNASGTTFKEVSGAIVKNFLFPLPPLKEQQAIIEKVNALMALCDELEQQIDDSQTQIEQLMQSCLKEVFEA